MEKYLRVGVITAPHGVHGEVKVFPTTDDVNRFLDLKSVILDCGKTTKELKIEGVRFMKQFVLLKLASIDDRTQAELYKQCDLLVSRENAVSLAENEYFICDLIGANVVTEDGKDFGVLTDILQTGANDVYIVKTPDGKEVLLPVIPECVLDVDVENALVKVHIMKGLI